MTLISKKHKKMPLQTNAWILIVIVLLNASTCFSHMETINIDSRNFDCYTADNNIRDIATTSDSSKIWTAGDGGLFLYHKNGSLIRKFTRKDGLSCNNIQEILMTQTNGIWLASLQGVIKYKNNVFVSFDMNTGLSDNRVYALGCDKSGNIYAGTHKGINILQNNRFSPLDDTHEFARRSVLDIHCSTDGSMWFAKNNALSHLLQPGTWEIFQKDILRTSKRSDIINNSLLCIVTDRKGQPLIGTRSGLGLLKDGSWQKSLYKERFHKTSGIKDNYIACIAIDSDKNIWIGHGDSKDYDKPPGLACFKNNKWTYITTENGLISDCIYKIRIDNRDRKWLASNAGGMCLNNGEIIAYATSNALPANCILKIQKIAEDTVGILAGSKVTVYHNGSPEKNQTSHSLSATRERRHDILNAEFSRNSLPEEIRRMRPRVIITDTSGNKWIGTARHGLLRYDGKSWTEILLHGYSLPHEITDLCFENDNILWIGSASEGAIRMKIPGKSDQ